MRISDFHLSVSSHTDSDRYRYCDLGKFGVRRTGPTELAVCAGQRRRPAWQEAVVNLCPESTWQNQVTVTLSSTLLFPSQTFKVKIRMNSKARTFATLTRSNLLKSHNAIVEAIRLEVSTQSWHIKHYFFNDLRLELRVPLSIEGHNDDPNICSYFMHMSSSSMPQTQCEKDDWQLWFRYADLNHVSSLKVM